MAQMIFTPRQQRSLNTYLKEIRHYTQLPDEQLRQLINQFQTSFQPALREQVFQATCHYVITVAKIQLAKLNPNQAQQIELLDLIQAGNMGLLEAILHYDTSSPIAFISYATFWIKKRINEFFYIAQVVKQPPLSGNFYPDYNEIYTNGLPNNYYNYDDADLVSYTSVQSLDQTLPSNDSTDTLYHQEAIRQLVHEQLRKLSPRETNVLCLTYGIDCPPTTDDEIAQLLQINSTETVRQIREKAQRKLSNYIDPSQLK